MKKTMKFMAMLLCAAMMTVGLASCERNDDSSDNPTGPSNGAFDQNGASNAVFSVAENKTVHFSKGNLQYQASTNTWRFAEHQYDYIGVDNANASSSYAGWIDLFGWGTSGWSGSGATYYHPWDSEGCGGLDLDIEVQYGPTGVYDLVGDFANADWGVYNRISNGGNQSRMWRTLTQDEWDYLFYERNASTVNYKENARFAKATIDNVTGLIVLPDSFTLPAGISLYNINRGYNYFSSNIYTTQQWSQLEANGAIFLPSAGVFCYNSYGEDLSDCYYCDDGFSQYWTTTSGGDGLRALRMEFSKNYLDANLNGSRSDKLSVRLVRD